MLPLPPCVETSFPPSFAIPMAGNYPISDDLRLPAPLPPLPLSYRIQLTGRPLSLLIDRGQAHKKRGAALFSLNSRPLSSIIFRLSFLGGIMKKLVVVLLLLASSASGEIYTWKDNQGTLFYTNSLYEIPARYRSRAKLLDVATGKKAPITAEQAAGPPQPTGTPGPSPAQASAPQPARPQMPAQVAAPQPAAGNSGPANPATLAARPARPPRGSRNRKAPGQDASPGT